METQSTSRQEPTCTTQGYHQPRPDRLKHGARSFVENTGEATAACLFMMVQGNLLAVGLSHWLIAAETGLIAGAITALLLTIWTARLWVVALLLGVVTSLVDFFVHPGDFGPVFMEAALTGLGAAMLALVIGALWHRVAGRRKARES